MERQLLRMHSSHFCILNLYLRDFFLVMTKARRLYPLLIDCQNQCPAPGVGGEEEQRVRWVTVLGLTPWAKCGTCRGLGPAPAALGAVLSSGTRAQPGRERSSGLWVWPLCHSISPAAPELPSALLRALFLTTTELTREVTPFFLPGWVFSSVIELLSSNWGIF